MFAYHLTFRPSCCNLTNDYQLQEKDKTIILNWLDKYSEVFVIAEENPGEISHHIHTAFKLLKNKPPQNIKQQLLNKFKKHIDFKITRGFNPCIKCTYHDVAEFDILAGGYVSKDKHIIQIKGITLEQLEIGNQLYEKLKNNKARAKHKIVSIKNFFHLVEDFIYLNSIDMEKYKTVSLFLRGIIKPMIKKKYRFIVAPRRMRNLILQTLETDDSLEEWFNEIESCDTTILSKKEYKRVIERIQYDLDE